MKKKDEKKLRDETDLEDDEEIAFEPEAEGPDGQPLQIGKMATLKKKIKKLKEEKEEYIDKLQRQQAEFQNVRRREEDKKREEIAMANKNLILEILPVVDSFEMAFADKEAYEKTPENWRKGVDYIYSQLLSTLENHEVKQLNPVTEEFDPNYHEAVDRVNTDKKEEDNKVLEVVQKGYKMNEKVIRTAKVKVGVFEMQDGENGTD